MLEEDIEDAKDKCSGEHLEEDYEALPPIINEVEGKNPPKEKLLKVLKENKKAIGYSLDDLTGIDPRVCMHRITLEDGFTPSAQPMRRLNEKLKEVVRKEVDKLLEAEIIYSISGSDWVSPVQIVPKKGSMTVVENEEVYGGVHGHFNVHGTSFDDCLKNLSLVLQICIRYNLKLNWEKCHFMVQKGVVLGHVISKEGIQVDKAKVKVIEKLPPPINVKGVRSFLGHAGFYRRFIKDFAKIAKTLTSLLAKDTPFIFDESCVESFCKLKQALISALIVQPPNWVLPF
ncbi:uncharacterized protein LOC141629581 [Silene latifolia]|uniref:uncharacterized protein LOC141629581 n=1 Tax=Silene latifolia TaxID=37657 RepID=UPI003D784A12